MKVTLDLSEREAKALMNACHIREQDLVERAEQYAGKDNAIVRLIEEEYESLIAVGREIILAVGNMKGDKENGNF